MVFTYLESWTCVCLFHPGVYMSPSCFIWIKFDQYGIIQNKLIKLIPLTSCFVRHWIRIKQEIDKMFTNFTVFFQTTGKFVTLQKFWVTAIASSRLSTTCHHPPGTNTVSPGHCKISSYYIETQLCTRLCIKRIHI